MKQLIQLGVLGAALLFALIGAYLVYFESDEGTAPNDDGVAVYVAQADQLQSVTYKADKKTVVLTRKSDTAGKWIEVEVTTRTEVAAPPVMIEKPDATDDTDDTDAGDSDAPVPAPPEPTITEEVERFVGNSAAEDLWSTFAPFKADRALTPESGLDMGFDEPYATLTVTRSTGAPVEVVFGGATYGDRARYVQSGGKTFLVNKRTLTTIASTAKLQERGLHPLAIADIASVTVTRGETTQAFVHKNPDDRAKRFWANKATPDQRQEAATQWLPNLVKLGVQAYPIEAPDGLTAAFSVQITGEGKTWNIEISSDGAEEPTWYAKTDFNRGTVTLTASQAEEIIADMDGVMNPQAATAPAPE